MKYIIFDFNSHYYLINSFLKSASVAHKLPEKSQEWFLWKFKDNPFGESILACAVDQNKIVGSVAIGLQSFYYEGKNEKAAISFETFVHPDYQGQGLFKKLISLAEDEARNRKIKFLLNFPNSNSLPGFIKSGWIKVSIAEYWIKPKNYLKLIFNIKEIKKSFVPNSSNFNDITSETCAIKFDFLCRYNEFSSIITKEYLEWRFLKFPVSEYIIVDNEHVFSIGRIGKRGKLKEIQILLFHAKTNASISLKSLKSHLKESCSYDIISFPISRSTMLRAVLVKNKFIRVPNNTNITYKVLDNSATFKFDILELQAINYHTY